MTRSALACKRVKILLGVFVLGGLRGEEESLVRTHLAGCARCWAEYEELADVPALLGLLTAEEASQAGVLPDQAGALPRRPDVQAGPATRPANDTARPSLSTREAQPPSERELSARPRREPPG
jgi:hypothetical protein